MTQPEELYFIPVENIRRRRGGRSEREDDVLAGPELITVAGDFINEDFRLTPGERVLALGRLQAMQATAVFNAPMLYLGGDGYDTSQEVAHAGYIGGPLVLQPRRSEGAWALAIELYSVGYSETWQSETVAYDLWGL